MTDCLACATPFKGRAKNSKYCSLPCQRKYLSKRWYTANKERHYATTVRNRKDPAKWEAEKARARLRNKSDKWKAYHRERCKRLRGSTLKGRVISLNAHVHSRKQSELYVAWQDVFGKFGDIDTWACAGCSSAEDLTFDHVIAFCDGGQHTIDNLQILCRSCNSSKGCYERWNRKLYQN